jgi:hypothetical protein
VTRALALLAAAALAVPASAAADDLTVFSTYGMLRISRKRLVYDRTMDSTR